MLSIKILLSGPLRWAVCMNDRTLYKAASKAAADKWAGAYLRGEAWAVNGVL